MVFPDTERVVFGKNTLHEVICQLRFPPILSIVSGEPADFQERIRAEYPFYRREDQQAVPTELALFLRKVGAAMPAPKPTHRFLVEEEDSSEGVTLTAEFVALSTPNYTRWEDFRSAIDRIQAALQDTYSPAPYTRIGLRYVNVINRRMLGLDEQPWRKFISPALLGLLGSDELADRVNISTTEAELRLAEGDASIVKLRYGLGETEEDSDVYILDGDFATTHRTKADDVLGILDSFHAGAGNLFRWAITPELHEALEPRALA
jgi:uncharacterized protein (TIGR04255 family)